MDEIDNFRQQMKDKCTLKNEKSKRSGLSRSRS